MINIGIAQSGLKKVTLGALVGDAINVWSFSSDYKHAKEEGDSSPVALMKAGVSFAWGEAYYGGISSVLSSGFSKIGMTGIGGSIATLGGTIAVSALAQAPVIASAMWQYTGKEMSKAYEKKGAFGSGHFNMSNAGYTMRQRSLNAIRNNGINIQSALGNEARQYALRYGE